MLSMTLSRTELKLTRAGSNINGFDGFLEFLFCLSVEIVSVPLICNILLALQFFAGGFSVRTIKNEKWIF